jgi:hypothetical protein
MYGGKDLDILDIVQSCPKCPKWAILEKPRKLQSFGSREFGTSLAHKKIGIRADPDSSRDERLVAIASVALPKRECGRSLKPRRKRGMWECPVVKGTGQAGRRARAGVPAKLGASGFCGAQALYSPVVFTI